MKISNILKKNPTSFSFEFFPPKTEKASQTLFDSISQLVPLKPAYVSVTYGAGGTTRKLTHDLVMKLQELADITVVPHLTCVGSSRDEIHNVIGEYHDKGIENILALRGDPPGGEDEFVPPRDGFTYSSELVGFIKKHYPDMGIGVAGFPEGHPQTPNRLKELEYLKKKVDEGADYICTQMFFDNRDFYDFCERCELAGINVPIIAGIMPITSRKGIAKMAELSAGSRFPAPLMRALGRVEDDTRVKNVGVHWATNQIYDLLDNGVKGVHLYTLNRYGAAKKIYETLGVSNSGQLSGAL